MAAAGVLTVHNGLRESRLITYPTPYTERSGQRTSRSSIGTRSRDMGHHHGENLHSVGKTNLGPSSVYYGLHVPESKNVYPIISNTTLKSGQTKSSHHTTLGRLSNSRKLLRQSSHWKSSIPHTFPSHSSKLSVNETNLPSRPHTSAGKTTDYYPRSVNWSSPYASISATGQGLLSESYKSRSFYNPTSTTRKHVNSATHLPHHTLINYVPFYDHQARGNNTRAVSASPEKNVILSTNSDNFRNSEMATNKQADRVDEALRLQSALRQSRPESPEWPGAAATMPRREKKKVRFSATIPDKMDEPEYVETLLQSANKRLQVEAKEGWTTPVDKQEDVALKSSRGNTPNEIASTVEDEEELNSFVTPITRITVTRRKVGNNKSITPDGAASNTSLNASSKNNGQKVQTMATKIITNYASKSAAVNQENTKPPSKSNEITPPTRLATRQAIGVLSARAFRKGQIMPISRYVQKKQAIISASFPDRPRPERQTFMSYATRLTRNENPRNLLQKSDRKSNTSEEPTSKDQKICDTRQKTGQEGGESKQHVQCISLDLRINNMAPTVTAMSVETPRTNRAILSGNATHFQPIPSMPDHINFCDPGKTEHILEWLDDVNKKRNIETRMRKRMSSSMSSRTIS